MAQSQDADPKTLFGTSAGIYLNNVGFFAAPMIGSARIDDTGVVLLCLRGGLIIRDIFTFGAFVSQSLNDISPASELNRDAYMDYNTAGGFAECTLLHSHALHLTFPLMVGYSKVEMDHDADRSEVGESNFLTVEPAILLEVNLFKTVWFDMGVGYRTVGSMRCRNLDQRDISGFTGHVAFKVGMFRTTRPDRTMDFRAGVRGEVSLDNSLNLCSSSVSESG